MRNTRQKIIYWTNFVLGCVLAGLVRGYVKSRFHSELWSHVFGLAFVVAGSWLMQKRPCRLTRVIHWVSNKWV